MAATSPYPLLLQHHAAVPSPGAILRERATPPPAGWPPLVTALWVPSLVSAVPYLLCLGLRWGCSHILTLRSGTVACPAALLGVLARARCSIAIPPAWGDWGLLVESYARLAPRTVDAWWLLGSGPGWACFCCVLVFFFF